MLGKVMPRLVGVNVDIGAILNTYVAISPAYFGRLNSWTCVERALSKELERIVRLLFPEEAYWVPLLVTYALAV